MLEAKQAFKKAVWYLFYFLFKKKVTSLRILNFIFLLYPQTSYLFLIKKNNKGSKILSSSEW